MDIGKRFEQEFRKVLLQLQETHGVAFHRLPDSMAAGSIIAEQPSDYVMAVPNGTEAQRFWFIEVKTSEKFSKLQKSMVRPAQRGAICRFRMKLGIPYFILFWDWNGGRIELWDGLNVVQEANLSVKDRLAEWPNCGAMGKLNVETVAGHIIDHFKLLKS